MEFLTPRGRSVGEIEAKRSRFIAALLGAETEAQAAAAVERERAGNPGARHHAWAFVAGARERCSDDGEPQGTAGQPILTTLKTARLGCAVLVVTRYFGGTLLGTGGLIRAYGGAARLAVQNADLVRMRRCTRFELACSYREYGAVETLCRRFWGETESPVFSGEVRVTALVPEENAPAFVRGVAEVTFGRCAVRESGEAMRPVPEG